MKPETKALADGIVEALKSQVAEIRKEFDRRIGDLPVPRDGKDGKDGEKGAQGDKGPNGDPGPKGDPGKDGSDATLDLPQLSKAFEEALNA